MRLKKLILQGFKSFADRTEFVFDSPITGIVGPNGCGKSNVVDAFKWVLGEQSAKSLRGEAMLDVIFNGSGNRKPAGMSEVILVFDNPKREDGSRMLNIDTDEVSVGRRLFRDGTSEYQLNNSSSRLKDIRELFLDTGVGVDAYSVIEQGKVAALLEANPAERRIIFEEAAGISKFKAKKKEAQRKLERVDQNLLRVTDIVEEVEKRLRSVKVAAGKARNYQEHSQRLRELRLTYVLQEYHTLRQQHEEREANEREQKAELERLATDLSEKQLALDENRRAFDSASQQKQRGDYERVQTEAAIQSAKQRQEYARQQIAQIGEQLAQFEEDRKGLAKKLGEVGQQHADEEQSLSRLTEDVSSHRQQIEDQQKAFHDTQLRLNQIVRDIEQNKSHILDLMRQVSAVSNRLGAIEIERKNIISQQQRLGQRRQVIVGEVETLDAGRVELETVLIQVNAELADIQKQIDEAASQAANLGKQIAQLSGRLATAREHRSGLMSRQKLLADLEAKREGFTEGVKFVLKNRAEKFPFIRGVVADLLSVDVEHAHVIEAALDGRDQMLISDSSSAVMQSAAIAVLEGRVNILCADALCVPSNGQASSVASPEMELPQTIEEGNILPFGPVDKRLLKQLLTDVAARYDWNQHTQRIRLAVDLVKFDPKDAPIAHHLLGRTIVVDSLADAAALHREALAGFRFVTKNGEVLESDGAIRVGPLTAAMGLISRRSELEALKHQIAEVDRKIDELSEQVSTGNAQARELQERQKGLTNSLYQLNTRKVETTSRITQTNDKLSAFRRELPVVERELQNFMDQFGRLKIEEASLVEKRMGMEAEQGTRQQRVEMLGQKQAEGNEAIRKLGEALTALRVQLGQVQEKQVASQQAVQRLAGQKVELAEQIQRIENSAQQIAGRRASVERDLQSGVEAEAVLETKRAKLEEQIEELAHRVKELGEKVSALDDQVREASAAHSEVEQSLHQLALAIGEVRVRIEGMVTRTMDELQLDLPARYAELDQQGGYEPGEMDWDAVASEIKELREKIQRLGNVNLDAIGEQEELEQRQTFLTSQVQDLTTSKQQLEQLIEEINLESSVRFEQTFNAVREHFQGMFRKLFGGGKADVVLETSIEEEQPPVVGPDGQFVPVARKTIDPLEAGIEIIAHPPGKKPVTISQLSGGEKTMTCVALLLSIFKSKPSPFCILDEVDAALDEANNQRFNLIVQEFLSQSQFIIITHSKRTMQVADVLYGVTMQEQGVSKRVAVKFDEVDSHGRIREPAAA